MPIYEFEAVDPGLNAVRVSITATNVHEALRKMEQRGYVMASLAEPKADGNHAAPRRRRRGPRALPFTTVRSVPVSEAGRVFTRPAQDVWACLCPHCDEALLFDRNELARRPWWPFPRRIRCARCQALFSRQQGFDQPYQGSLPAGEEEKKRSYLAEIILGVIIALVSAGVMAVVGLKG